MFQRQADAMIFDKNRLAKFYEQNTWENFTNVWEIFTNVWKTACPGKIVSVQEKQYAKAHEKIC